MAKLKALPIRDSQMWEWLVGYAKLKKQNQVLADVYLHEAVPEQLQRQVRRTADAILANTQGKFP